MTSPSSNDPWLNRVPVQNQDVAWRMVDEECIIIVPETSQATVLNPVGARLWELSDGKRTVGQIVLALVDEYDVDPKVAEDDARDFMEQLAKRGLLSLTSL